jgi:hypothetical protein
MSAVVVVRTLGRTRGRGITRRWEREGIFRQLAVRRRRTKVVAGGE